MSIKKNFVFNSLLTVSKYIFPFLTYPYVARALGVEKIGVYNFIDSIVGYFIIFSMMGINVVGIRSIAKSKGNTELLKQSFSSLFFLNLIGAIVAISVLFLATIFSPQLMEQKQLVGLGALKILFNVFLFEWLFQGLEDFKYITIRSMLLKVLYVVAVFIFIHNGDDYVIYYLLSVLLIIFNGAVDFWYAKKIVGISFGSVKLKPFFKPFVNMGIYYLISNLYISFNVAYLGFVAGSKEVGYYSTAVKLYSIIMAVFTAFTTVMSPRISSLIAEEKEHEIKALLQQSFELLIMISFPLLIFSFAMAPEIVGIISGPGYEGAVWPMRILTPLILIVGLEQILIVQLLIPFNRDRAVMANAIIGAVVGIVLNLFLVEKLGSIGSAIVWLAAEVSVLFAAGYFVRSAIEIHIPTKKILANFIYSLPYVLIGFFLKNFHFTAFTIIILTALFFMIYFILLQVYLLKNEMMIKQINSKILFRFRKS